MNIISFIPEQLFSLIAALYVLGVLFKSSSLISDEYIPFLLLALGTIASCMLIGTGVMALIQGILCTGVAIGINESIKQYKKF